ncbi:hypothetical protein [Cellulomonas sp. RIT-PI-Y]|uniref:hypothetical protein n=1 Tax=Cellulomonas sp. RIT-PI-Y TaxID=3035297 RepID=UPI0021DAECED|nr:hypothetical protein [Cellulomonas sp. RIT-PI-Y]
MPTVLLLPDSALLVPGASGALADPLGEARSAALQVLQQVPRHGTALVIAPGRRARVLSGPFGDGLAAAGIGGTAVRRRPEPVDDGRPEEGTVVRAAVPGVGAAAALALLRLTGHEPDRTATVLEVAPGGVPAPPDPDSAIVDPGGAAEQPEPDVPGLPSDPRLVVVVGSLSARHGPDAPLPDDPAAIAVDVALLTALAAGPRALAEVLRDLRLPESDRLAITGGRPWRAALSLLARDGALPDADAELLWSGAPGGAQHAVARWRIAA